MQPDVSIILPIYNVEPYLRQCLDSVLQQTLRETQIICINDGSTDGSLKILQEYADRDSRLIIIDQENQGPGATRNNALPYIRAKYTYFADPDDWLELDLCEKAARRMDETNADLLCFRFFREYPMVKGAPSHHYNPMLPNVRVLPEHRTELLHFRNVTWYKLWRTEFLRRNKIRFSEICPYEDVIQHWKGCALAEGIAILDEPLYHYRLSRPGSYQIALDKKHFAIVDAMKETERMLKECGKYNIFHDAFVLSKLTCFQDVFTRLPNRYRSEFRLMILDALSEAEHIFLESAPRKVHAFYRMLERQGFFETAVFRICGALSLLEKFLRRNVISRLKNVFR